MTLLVRALEPAPAYYCRHCCPAFTAFSVVGLVAAVSLLLRHWKSIEATAAPVQQSTAAGPESEAVRQPLLEQVCFTPIVVPEARL